MESEYRVVMKDIHKSFSGVPALKGVDLKIKPGEIHALLGENGAGKSTLMKILAGSYTKDSGEIFIDGEPVEIRSPKEGKEKGVGTVYQEFELAGDLTVAENICIDHLSDGLLINWPKLYERAKAALDNLGFDIDPRKKVNELSVAYQQVVEIAKVLSANAKILIMDEPTAVLTPNESEKLFEVLFKLKAQGVSIIYISHRMDEIFRLSDTITTMRDGEVTGTDSKENLDTDRVIERMIGRRLDTLFPERKAQIGETILQVKELSGGVFNDVSFEVKRGEVLGFFGLVGSGRTEIMRAIFGADPKKGGSVILDGKELHVRSPKDAIREGIALAPENRKEQGLVLEFPIKSNMTMANIKSALKAGNILDRKKENALAQSLVEKLEVKTSSIDLPVKNLSGGNQQKVVLAKWFNTDSQMVIFDEPTRGVDVGARIEIYNLINEFAERGLGVIIISSEMAEILGMCDRVVIINEGRKAGELKKKICRSSAL